MDVHGWRAYYADGSTVDSAASDWAGLPKTGMVGVVVFLEPPYRRIVSGGDWYFLWDGGPACTETHDEWGEWVDRPSAPEPEVKRGEAVDDETWAEIDAAMLGDHTWP